jgi:hypothetical protein
LFPNQQLLVLQKEAFKWGDHRGHRHSDSNSQQQLDRLDAGSNAVCNCGRTVGVGLVVRQMQKVDEVKMNQGRLGQVKLG